MRAATGKHPITPTGGINDGFKRGDALATSYWYSFVLIVIPIESFSVSFPQGLLSYAVLIELRQSQSQPNVKDRHPEQRTISS